MSVRYRQRLLVVFITLFSCLSALSAYGQSEIFCIADFLKARINRSIEATSEDTQKFLNAFLQHDPRRLETELPLHKLQGGNNEGIHYYTAPDGTSRIIKVLTFEVKTNPETAEIDVEHRYISTNPESQRSLLIQELRGAQLLEKAGGPKLYSYGVIDIQGKKFAYVEMEPVFKDGNFITLKGGDDVTIKLLKNMNRHTPEFMDQIVNSFMDCLKKGINPDDPDFAVAEKGEKVRWIDGGLWVDYALDDPKYSAAFTSSLNQMRTILDGKNSNNRGLGELFIQDFFSVLKKSDISPDLKTKLSDGIERIRSSKPKASKKTFMEWLGVRKQ